MSSYLEMRTPELCAQQPDGVEIDIRGTSCALLRIFFFKFSSQALFVRFEHRAWRKTPLKPKVFKHSIGRFAPPVQAGKHASRSANQIEAPSPAGTISAPPLGGRFAVRAQKIMFSGLSPLDLPLSGVLEIHVHTFPGFPFFHGYSCGL